MRAPFPTCSPPALVFLALLASFFLCGDCQAQGPAAKAAKQAAKEELKSEEAVVLTEAYILLKAADHDYDGHRAAAAHALGEACNILHADLLKHGSVQQKIKVLQDKNAAHTAKGAVHEAQALSDAQLRNAAGMIKQVSGALAKNKQHEALKHVNHALKEIDIALKIR